MTAIITPDAAAVKAADGVVLPGVGAFADAIAAREDLEVLGDTEAMQFDDEDNLVPVAAAGAPVHA